MCSSDLTRLNSSHYWQAHSFCWLANQSPHALTLRRPDWHHDLCARAIFKSALTTGASDTRRPVRANGYIGSIVVNAVLLYGVGHLVEWQIGWITPAWSDVVWALNLSLEVSLAANALFFLYDHDWFRYPVLAVCSLFALQAVFVLYAVFPFDFGIAWNDVARLALLALIMAIGIGTLVTAVLALLRLARTAARELGLNV